MKKLINEPSKVLEEMIEGFALANLKYVKRLEGFNVLVRQESSKDKVALLSGGGSGHEPAHAGYIGYGMLDCAVLGEVFTSPTPDQVYEGIKSIDNGNGVLLIVKNYTGDVMNFEMAKELAQMDGIEVEEVIVNDDVALENSTFTTGRRGVCGTVLVHKIAGAMAEKGASLQEVKRVAEKVIENVKTMGVALSSCIVPQAGKPNFTLKENEIEMGIGIHGEPGIYRGELKSAKEITKELLDNIFKNIDLNKDDEVCVMVNSLGSTPNMELSIIYKNLHEIISEKSIKIYKNYVGQYMTSLEMAGISITVLKLDEELKELLDSKCDTVVFK